MNRGLFVTLAVISTLASHFGGFVRDVFGAGAPVRGRTPPPGGSSHGVHHRHRPHAPNDGRWHMKYHRSRH